MATESRLKPLAVKNAKPGWHPDGGSLYLVVAPQRPDGTPGSRRWLYKYRDGDRVRDMSLGDAAVIGLADARKLRDDARRQRALGSDPIEKRKADKAKGATFSEMVDKVLASDRITSLSNAKHRDQWRYTLREVAEPLVAKPVASITTSDVLAVLRPLWADGKHETASRLRARIEHVIEVARSEGTIADDRPNAARLIAIKLHAPKVRGAKEEHHHAALPYQRMPELMAWLRAKDRASERALEWTILTACRSSETLGATADEVDFATATWIIPPPRMKARKAHRVPLCQRALEIAKGGRGRPFLFEGKRRRPLSHVAMLGVLKGFCEPNVATVHGMRSSFDQWASEVCHAEREVIERCLAHAVKGKTQAAYDRSDLLDRRRAIMTAWAGFLNEMPR
jgi:integrase